MIPFTSVPYKLRASNQRTRSPCASVPFAPHATPLRFWRNDPCTTSLSSHVLRLVPVIGHVGERRFCKREGAPGGR